MMGAATNVVGLVGGKNRHNNCSYKIHFDYEMLRADEFFETRVIKLHINKLCAPAT